MEFHRVLRFFLFLSVVLGITSFVSPAGNGVNDAQTTPGTPNTGKAVGIWFCNFFPNTGSMMVYVVPAGQSATTFVPNGNAVGSVNYGDCDYFPKWGVAGSIIQLATYLSDPVNGNTFFQFTPITTTNNNGVSAQTTTIVYNTASTTKAITTLPINSLTPFNPEAENQNLFIASPLTNDPPNLNNGYQIQSAIPPFAFSNQVGAETISPILQPFTKIPSPVRNICFNFAPGIANGGGTTFNVAGYANANGPHDFDTFLVGGASPNVNFNGNTVVQSPTLTATAPFFTLTNTATVQVVSTPATNGLGGFSSNGGNLAANDITYGVFGGFHAFDFNSSPLNNDPGFILMPTTANSGGPEGEQIGGTWWINGNHPPFSVTIWSVFGTGTEVWPYITKSYTFSASQQASLAAYASFLSSQLNFAEKNNINPAIGGPQ